MGSGDIKMVPNAEGLREGMWVAGILKWFPMLKNSEKAYG